MEEKGFITSWLEAAPVEAGSLPGRLYEPTALGKSWCLKPVDGRGAAASPRGSRSEAPPGNRLGTMASRVCSAREQSERLVNAVIREVCRRSTREAIRDGRAWQSRGALIVGYVAFVKVFLLCGLYGATHAWHDWNADDQRNLRRVFWLTAVVTLLVATLIEMPQLLRCAILRRGQP